MSGAYELRKEKIMKCTSKLSCHSQNEDSVGSQNMGILVAIAKAYFNSWLTA